MGSALILSLLIRATTSINYEQESMSISNKMPQSSNGNAPEQHWNRTWGGNGNDTSICIALDSSDNIYITGIYNVTSEPSSSISSSKDIVAQPPPTNFGGDVVLLKYDSSGILQWNTTWGGSGRDEGRAIAVDSSDNIYLVGNSAEGGVVFLKYDSSGELIWDKSWSSLNSAMAITIDSVDNIFINGSQSGSVIIWKYNSLGVYQWERTWEGGVLTDTGYGIAVDSSINIYITGLIYNSGSIYDLFLLKYDSSGNLQWNTTWGGSEFEVGTSIAIDSSNNILIGGITSSYGAGEYDLFLVAFDSSGQLQWNTTWGGSEFDGGWDILSLDQSGNIYIGAGTENFGAGLMDGILLNYSSTGQQQWNTTWGGSGNDGFNSIIVDSSDNIFLTGYTDSFGAGGDDIILVKYSQSIIPVDGDGFEISGYNLFSLFSAIGLISIIIIKKWRKSTISLSHNLNFTFLLKFF